MPALMTCVTYQQYNVGIEFSRCVGCVVADKDDTERVHHPRLPGQVDADDQVCVYDARGVSGTESWEGRTARPRRQLLRQHLLLSLPKVRQERGQETRGGRLVCQFSLVYYVLNL